MNNKTKIFLLLFIVGSLLVVNTAIVSACSCISPAPPKESLEESTAVFAGKVIDVDVPRGIVISSADPVKVTFDVSKVWKGSNYKALVVTTARDGASCGYSFKQGEEYIVYAYGEEDELSTGICSRTKLLASAQEDLQELGEGNLPTNSGSNSDEKPPADCVSWFDGCNTCEVVNGQIGACTKKGCMKYQKSKCLAYSDFVHVKPDADTGPIEVPTQEKPDEGTSYFCSGCELEKKCFPFGYRKSGKFCSDENYEFIEQKKAESSCENNFECSSNVCVSEKCVSESFIQKILNWFKRLFG